MNVLALLHVDTSPTVCDEGIEMTSKVGQKPQMKLLSIDYTYLHPLPIHHALVQWVLALLAIEEQFHMVTFLQSHCVHVIILQYVSV